MTRHDTLDDQAREACALAALGVLPPDEAAAFEAHAADCPACRTERASLAALAGELAVLAPAAEPPERLWSRIADRVRATPQEQVAAAAPATVQPWKAWTASPEARAGMLTIAAGDGGWQATSVPGIDVRQLFVDPAADRVTMLVRMAAGAAYPPHRHATAEECFVLQGDIRVDGATHMHAGDYQRAEAGSRHGVQSTDGGCMLLIVSSLRDELLPLAS
jgi:anti-sigma factor ChrR (cupin superfamily)